MKLIAGIIWLQSFRRKLNFNSDDKCYVNTTPEWNQPKGNICAGKYFIKIEIIGQKIKTKINFTSFSGRLTKFHFETYVNTLLSKI